MKTRRSTTLLVRIVAVALIAIGVVGYRESDHAGGTDASEIGVATQEVRTATATARIGEIATVSTHTSEKVRYDDASLRIVASDTVDVGTLDPEKAAFFFQRAEFVEVRAEVLATKAAAAS
jgi:hypothetical protein